MVKCVKWSNAVGINGGTAPVRQQLTIMMGASNGAVQQLRNALASRLGGGGGTVEGPMWAVTQPLQSAMFLRCSIKHCGHRKSSAGRHVENEKRMSSRCVFVGLGAF